MGKEKKADSGPWHSSRTRVLFVCVGNACRSPMAEAIARYDAADVIDPSSAGLSPLGCIAEQTRETLVRNGYSANGLTSNVLTPEAAETADLIVNMTGRQLEGSAGGHWKVEDWIVQDPYGASTETYQRVFDGIKRRVYQLAEGLREKRQQKIKAR